MPVSRLYAFGCNSMVTLMLEVFVRILGREGSRVGYRAMPSVSVFRLGPGNFQL